MYRSDLENLEELSTAKELPMDEYQAFEATQTGDWKIRLLVPTKEYYQQVYVMALNLSLLTLALIAFCILVSYFTVAEHLPALHEI